MISGLTITDDFITSDYETTLIDFIKKENWNTTLSRRTQHYGYKYNYKSRSITDDDYLGDFPEWLSTLIDYVMDNANLKRRPDQVIINEYTPGQGISPHIDAKHLFDDHICSLSLSSDVIIIFSRYQEKKDIHLKRCSFLEMEGIARYRWCHRIVSRKSDKINVVKQMRNTRYSITFRKVKIE